MHYNRWQKHGDPLGGLRRRGYVDADRYGTVRVGRSQKGYVRNHDGSVRTWPTREDAERWIDANQPYLRGELPEDFDPGFDISGA